MIVLCGVCRKLFIDSTDIYTTFCGHVFHYQCLLNWLERSRSCPQCRCEVCKITIQKLYFAIENDELGLDATTFLLSLKENEIKNLNEAITVLKNENLVLKELKYGFVEIKSKINDLQNNLCFYKNRAAETNRLAEEIVKLKSTIKNMKNAKIIMNGTSEQVTSILNENNSIESLTLLGATLKMSLVESEIKSRDTNFLSKEARNEIQWFKKENVLLEKQNAALRRKFNLFKLQSQIEKNVLKSRLRRAIQNNIVVANPNAGNSDTILTTTVDSVNNLSVNAKAGTSKTKKSLSTDLSNMENSQVNLSTSPNMSERTIVRLDSPFVPEKSNGHSYFLDKYPAPSTAISNSTNEQFSIFSIREETVVNMAVNSKREDITYVGLGGSQYPSSQRKPIKRPKTSLPLNKFRRLTRSSYKK